MGAIMNWLLRLLFSAVVSLLAAAVFGILTNIVTSGAAANTIALIALFGTFVVLMALFIRGANVSQKEKGRAFRASDRARADAASESTLATRQGAAPAPSPTLTRDAPAFVAPDLFISYKREERPEVLAIVQRLQALKLKVWFDAEMRSGSTFDAEIEKNVRAARCVLVCWSPGAVASDWVRGEATIGRQRGVLAAVLLKPCDLPAPFNLVHAEDLTAGIGPQNPDWLKMLERVGGLVARPGIAGFEALDSNADRRAVAAWMADYPHDPLFEDAAARLKRMAG